MKTFMTFVFLSLLCASTSFADVIYLKNGQKVKGEIFQETGYSYKIKVNGIPTTYYINEVEKVVKGDEPAVAATGAAAPVSPAKQELVVRLLDANGSRQNMVKVFGQIISNLPEKERSSAQSLLKVDDVIAQIVPIYAKYYTEAELKEMVTFYRSPVGVKQIETLPKIMDETMKEISRYFETKLGAGSR